MNAGDIMTTRVISVLPETSVREVARILHANLVSAVPVATPDGRVIGMLSEGDLVRRLPGGPAHGSWWLTLPAGEPLPGGYAVPHDLCASEVMTRDVVRITEDTPLAEVARLLETRRVKRLPVERNGKLIGIVSRANLAHGLASQAGGSNPVAGDAALRAAILETLERSSVSTHLMNVIVTQGIAWLWGAVETVSEEAAALAAANAVPGVKRVANHLFVLSSRLHRPAARD
jgi:CBS domain-containing protein